MTVNRYYLAVDIGTSSGCHILGWVENGKMNLREIYRFSSGMGMVNGTLCWNLVKLFEEIKAGMRECKKLGINPKSMGTDTWAVGPVLLNRQGHVLGKTASYRDRRTEGMDPKVYERISREELYRRTGIQKQILSTVCQLMAVKEKQPDILSQTENFLMIPGYLNFLLTGVQKQGYTNATTTQLVNPSECTWDRELIEVLGYPQKLFGGLSMPGTMVGRLSENMQKETGLDCRVALPATHDTGSAVAAISSNRDHVLYINSGAWSLVGTELKDTDCREMSMGASFANGGGYEYRYHFFKNIMGLWMIQSVRKEWKESGEDYSFGEACRRVPREAISSIMDCDNNRFLAPESMCKTVKTYCGESGQQVPEAKWEMVAVIYNNLADCCRICCREIGALADVKYDYIHTVGDGANADYLDRLTAEATGKTVYAGPTEAMAIGNLTVQVIEGKELRSLKETKDNIFCSFEIKAYEPSEKV